jgi:hypothetical protein
VVLAVTVVAALVGAHQVVGQQHREQAAAVEAAVLRKMEALVLKKISGQIGLEMSTAPAVVAEAKAHLHLVRHLAQVTAEVTQVSMAS